MKKATIDLIDRVRSFNRFYLRQLGVMNEKFLNNQLSLPEIRLMFEIQHCHATSARQLSEQTLMDKGYVSRLIKGLIKSNLIDSTTNSGDARSKVLSLTAEGNNVMTRLEQKSRIFTTDMINHLSPDESNELVNSMSNIQQLISPSDHFNSVVIRSFKSGDIGTIINRHAVLYEREYGWDKSFEGEVVELFDQFYKNFNPLFSQLWVAEVNHQFAGCIAIMKEEGETARLRTLLVEPKFRGLSIGRQLIDQCLSFARQKGYKKIVLWTCAELTQARKLYRLNGFIRIKSWTEKRFGTEFASETWELKLGSLKNGRSNTH